MIQKEQAIVSCELLLRPCDRFVLGYVAAPGVFYD